jgi:hypothetical protein
LAKSNVFVPVGGGLDADVDSYLLQPPKSATANNVVVRKAGSYQKLPGTPSNGYLSPADAGILITDPSRNLMYVGQDGHKKKRPSSDVSWETQDPTSGLFPCKVTAKPVIPVRGAILSPAIAHHPTTGHTVVACSFLDTHPESNLISPYSVYFAIVDSTGSTVAFWRESADGNIYPRVEPVTVSGTPYFVFFVLDGNPDASGPAFTLKTARVNPSSPPATLTWTTVGTADRSSVSTTGENLGLQQTSASVRFLYDTHGHYNHSAAYCVYFDGTDLVANYTDGNTVSAPCIVNGAPDPGGYAIFYHHNSSTVVVYDTNPVAIYTNEPTLASPFTLHGTTPVTTAHPVFYGDNSSGISTFYMDGMEITASGSNPGTLSFANARLHSPTKTFDPQVVPTEGLITAENVICFNHENNGIYGAEGQWLDMVGVVQGGRITLAPIMQTRQPLSIDVGLLQEETQVARYCQPQSTVDADYRVLIPYIASVPASRTWPQSESGTNFPVTSIVFDGWAPNQDRYLGYITIDFSQTALEHSVVPYQGSLLVASGNVNMWDGGTAFDLLAQPFISDYDDGSPPALTTDAKANTSSTAGNQLATTSTGYFNMKVVLVYTDRNGIEYRSAPSPVRQQQGWSNAAECPVITITLDDSHQRLLEAYGAAVSGAFDVEFYTTPRPGPAAAVDVVNEYYLAQRYPLMATAGTYHFPDLLLENFNGTDQLLSAPLYTDLDELAPIRPPASNVVASAGSYLFLLPSEKPDEIWPTKPIERGRGPEWAPELILSAPASAGKIISLAGQGDRLILLCDNGLWELFVGGGGPDATGQGSFGQYRNIHLGDGCVSHSSVVSTRYGVFYVSENGPKMVRPDGSVEDIGRGVGRLDGIRKSVYHAGAEEIWVLLEDDAKIYNLVRNVWTTATFEDNVGSQDCWIDAVWHNGEFWRRRISTGIAPETATSAQENGDNSIPVKVVSPWLAFDSPTGWKRCRRITVLGRQDSALVFEGSVVIKLAYDYVNTDVETYTFDATDIQASNRDFQLRIKPARQKFDSIRITVEDGYTNDFNDHRWSLIGYELEMEAKSGVVKLQESVSG